MRNPGLFMASLGLFLSGLSQANAYSISAGVREFYNLVPTQGINPVGNDYGGDSAAKMKILIFNTGVESMTLQLRFGVMNPNDSVLFDPVFRTNRTALEVMTSRIAHGNGVAVFKPMIYQNPQLGTPSAIPELNSASDDSILTSYNQLLSVYRASASLRSIDEFVLGAGLGKTLRMETAARWKAILSQFRSSLNPATTLSLEVSSETSLVRLEAFYRANPGLFFDTWSGVDKVRFELPIQKFMDPSTLKLDTLALHAMMVDRIQRIHQILPNRKIGLSNVIIPGCFNFTSDESEVTCPAPEMGYTNEMMMAQANALNDFFSTLDSVSGKMGYDLDSVEIIFATTQSEPLPANADPRFLIYNKFAVKVLSDHLQAVHQFSASFSSPAKSPQATALWHNAKVGQATKMACIYFDEMNAQETLGAIHSRMLETLIGAFPDWRRERRSVSLYQADDLKNCDTVFYLSTNFNLVPPANFYADLARYAQSHTLTWFNYKYAQFSKVYDQMKDLTPLAFHVPYILQPDQPPTPEKPDPGFYRYFDYKGETFEKLATWDPVAVVYANSPELGYVEVNDPKQVKILATARHSTKGTVIPYVVQQNIGTGGSIYYIADLPFSFIHYEDRYLIFCDVIYDILNEPTPKRPPVALVRLEDINSAIPTEDLTWVIDYLGDRSIPYAMALIPYYSGLFFDPGPGLASPVWMPSDQFPEFAGTLRYAKARGAQFVMHGVAHQAGDLISGFDGSSGSDYEFWSWPDNKPLPQDDPAWMIKRLELGEAVLQKLGIRPIAWEVPHYAGSSLDYRLFGKLFEWNYHRNLTFKGEIISDANLTTDHEFFDCVSRECRDERLKLAQNLKVETDYSSFGTQIIPYPIYQDTYGQSLIPESLGMVDFAMYESDTWRAVTFPEDILRRAKKLRVVRGAVASFFWHPVLLDTTNVYYQQVPGSYESIGGQKTLTTLIDGLKDLGYEFRSIADCDLFPRKNCPQPQEKKI